MARTYNKRTDGIGIRDLAKMIGWGYPKLYYHILHRDIPGPTHQLSASRTYYTRDEAAAIAKKWRV